MTSEYYDLTTLWVIAMAGVIGMAVIRLYRQGKAPVRVQLMAGLLFALYIIAQHWFFGLRKMPANLSGSTFFALILAGAGALLLLFFFTSYRYFKNIAQDRLQLMQGLRVFIGGTFLAEGVLRVIPGWFSIMDGFMHIASGFLALNAAVASRWKSASAHRSLWLANIIGVTDILVIVTSICFIVWPQLGPHHNMHYIVFSGGPVLLWLHGLSVARLIVQKRQRS